jgi:hypothetical protein
LKEFPLTFILDTHRYGLDARFALDIASVKIGVRPRGLLHVHASQASSIHSLLTAYGLKILAERQLEGSRDPSSREGILSDLKSNTPHDRLWHEIWFSQQNSAQVDSAELFRAPGFYLSYPPCCVDAMLATQTLSTIYDLYINDSQHRYWEINRLTTIFTDGLLMPDFFPCSLACCAARDFASPFIDMAASVLGAKRASEWIVRAKQPYFVYQDALFTAFDYECEDNHLTVTMESMSKTQLRDIGKTITHGQSHFALIPFRHFYAQSAEPLQITLRKDGQRLMELTAPPEGAT